MTTAFEVPPNDLIEAMAKALKEDVKFTRPDWAAEVKTGPQKERAPDDEEWWWVRTASILRKIYVNGPTGTQKLRVAYGGKKNRGRRPEVFRKAGGKILRTILQQLDEVGYTEKDAKKRKGRILTPKGVSFIDKQASKIAQENV